MKPRNSSVFASLVVALLCGGKIAEACSCAPLHPQQAFCNADVVIRAKVVAKKEFVAGNDVYGNPIKRIQYDIKQIKMFKGPDQDVTAVFTAPSSAMCGVSLEAGNGKDYLITGHMEIDGTLYVTMCDFLEPWNDLTHTQMTNLNERYQSGCNCRVVLCQTLPCAISAPEECLWTDRVLEGSYKGTQARNYACIERSDASCSWYRGSSPPKKDFLDIEDP
ncbi:metalloproteinase inhibitor 2-like [Denticeps clupeoides]|uniref:Metalloproteinase inhibitor 2 n=1 Tax=Denticeps clupeoides TaxID=299321 RepID=A0AAY4AQW0_9TELE|nr:metalloproteinase inhibitor 2-like [Denticeps clupeoides]